MEGVQVTSGRIQGGIHEVPGGFRPVVRLTWPDGHTELREGPLFQTAEEAQRDYRERIRPGLMRTLGRGV